MKSLIKYIILFLIITLISSCKIKIPTSNDENGEGSYEGNFLHDPQPANNSTNVSLTPLLNWVYNSNSSAIVFYIYLDTVSALIEPKAIVNSNNYYVTTPLKPNRDYYWKVSAIFEGTTYQSELWRFTTISSGRTGW